MTVEALLGVFPHQLRAPTGNIQRRQVISQFAGAFEYAAHQLARTLTRANGNSTSKPEAAPARGPGASVFESLPEDLATLVLSNLESQDLASLRRTCKWGKQLVDTNAGSLELWLQCRSPPNTYLPSALQSKSTPWQQIGTYPRQLAEQMSRLRELKLHVRVLTRADSVSIQSLDQMVSQVLQPGLPHLQSFQLLGNYQLLNSGHLQQIVDCMPNLKRLRLQVGTTAHCPCIYRKGRTLETLS